MSALPERLTMADIAADLGVLPDTVNTYNKRAKRRRLAGTARPGDLPEPDASLGRTPGWTRETYLRWKTELRPGQGKGGGRPWPTADEQQS